MLLFGVCSFVRSSRWQVDGATDVQDNVFHNASVLERPDPDVAETIMSVQCASPGRGGELVGVCGVCAHCVGWKKA